MEPISESQGARRLRILARIALAWALIILARLAYLQIYQHHDYLRQAIAQSYNTIEAPAPRGRILDRTGQTLAISVPADTIVVNPRIAPDLSVARDIFVPILDLDGDRLQARIDWAVKNNRGYLPIKQKVSPEESRKIRGLKLDWVEFHRDSRRCYPKDRLAANVIGGVNHRGAGNAGLELSFDKVLMGRSGVARILRDARGKAIHTEIQVPPRPGSDIGITIDERIQYVADQALARAAHDWNCPTGSLVVMDPKTGDILAMSNYPSFDPNQRVRSARDLRARTNLAISTPFEPGSVFKVVTISAALETTDLTPETMIDCGPGVFNLFGRRIHDIHAYGTMPLKKVLWKSSNIGAIQAGLRVGKQRLWEYVSQRFGFGHKTGIELPAESSGRVRPPERWQRTSIGSVSMGHEISATSLQIALAASVIANGGLLRKPRLVRWTQAPGGERIEIPVAPAKRAIRPETAITMRRMMEGVVLHGTGRRAHLTGFSSGGKTGSAQIFDFATRHYTHKYNASYVGFAPVADPSVVVAVTLNGAAKYGAYVAGPVFREVTQTALRILGAIPDVVEEPRYEEPEPGGLQDLAIAGLGAPPELPPGEVDYPAEANEADDGTVLMAGQASSPYVFGPMVPNFRGKTLRVVLEETSRRGIPVEYTGAGVARSQFPPPGSVLPVGERVWVEFAR